MTKEERTKAIVNYRQSLLLSCLQESRDNWADEDILRENAWRFDLEKPFQVTACISSLVTKGFVYREERCDKNGIYRAVVLTDKGKAATVLTEAEGAAYSQATWEEEKIARQEKEAYRESKKQKYTGFKGLIYDLFFAE